MLIFKNSLIKIKHSLGRFITLILIVALGAAFFAGIRETSSDMIKTLDNYYDETNLLDYHLISTMGLTQNDLDKLKDLDSIGTIEENYSMEIEINGDATKIYGISKKINNLKLIKGRMPLKNDECISLNGMYNIGDIINIKDNDFLNNNQFKIVGIANSSMYIYKNLGISTVSDGKLDKVIYIPKDNFKLDYYTEIYMIAKNSQNKTSYKNSYINEIKKLKKDIEDLAPIQETKRYEQIKTDAMKEIYKAKDKLNKEKKTNETKLNDAKYKLDNSKRKINNGFNSINSGFKELERKKLSIENDFQKKEKDLKNALETINQALQEIGINGKNIDENINILNTKINEINNLLNTLDKNSQEYIENKNILDNLNNLLNNLKEIKNGQIQLENGKKTWKINYNNTLNKLNNNKQELLRQQQKLNNGYNEYYQNYNKFQKEMKDALQKITDKEKEINEIEKPKWYLLEREDNLGYTTFLEASQKIDSIAAVFPVFFIAIALLMCLNTMSRMIEEERTEIGILSSLGINKFKITFSYVLYVLVATSIGIIIGLSIGYTVVPRALYKVYTNTFIVPELKTYANPLVCITIIFVCITAMSGVTISTINKHFKTAPANLLRPKSPRIGQNIFLEHITFIWKHISFSWKVTLRNLFRYKKRIIMTLIGTSGCTALLLTGFGIKDSIAKILDIQFKEIQTYDSMLILKDETKTINPKINNLLKENKITNPLYSKFEQGTITINNKKSNIYSIAFENNEISDYFKLKDKNNKPLVLSNDGAIITQKIAELLKIKIGDTFTMRDSNNNIHIIKVNNICQNYFNNYIYMSKDYYQHIFKNISYNNIFANINNKGETLLKSDYFSNIQYTKDSFTTLKDLLTSMNSIVFLIIIFSSLLAITVLYNLTSINISERLREIATLKVLGFNDREVSMYVYRETIIITTIGIFLGLFLGNGLNNFVLAVADMDIITFIKKINILSYIFAILIMTSFTIIVQILTNVILKKVNMIDSLKSVE